jgi:Ca2+-binding RTX toxin-like protein
MAKIFGTGAPDILHGTNAHDEIWGLASNDRLYGEAGDDVLMGGAGADYLHGGAGFDTASYSSSSAGVVVSLITNSAAYGDAQGDTFTYIENLIGSYHADTLIGHNGPNVINGGSGNDTLKGYGADDTLRGEDGDDILDGGSRYDTMIGGLGNDTYLVDHPNDSITEFGGQGTDVVRTSASYTLTEGADIETLETTDANGTAFMGLYGNSSGNQIIGNDGANNIDGRGGVDQMIGRGGNDQYFVDNANDSVIENGGQGNDVVFATVSYTLTAGADVEVLDAIYTAAAINLTGNANGNVVRGNDGNNTLNGADGRDDLLGRGGQDSFLFDTPLNAATNVDRVIDFNVADDTILLDRDIFSSSLGLGNISAGEFVIGTAAQDANDRIIYDSNSGALFYDNDGVGGNAATQFAQLSTGLALTNLDFLVVA